MKKNTIQAWDMAKNAKVPNYRVNPNQRQRFFREFRTPVHRAEGRREAVASQEAGEPAGAGYLAKIQKV